MYFHFNTSILKLDNLLYAKSTCTNCVNSSISCGTFFILKPSISKNHKDFDGFTNGEEYSSKDFLITKDQLDKILKKFNYFNNNFK